MEDITQYPYLFDRQRTSHPWLSSLGKLQKSTYMENVALAENWRMDHRVSERREQELINTQLFPEGRTKQSFDISVLAYFETHLCVPSTSPLLSAPAYLRDANSLNLVQKDRISPKQELVHFASLRALLCRTLSEFKVQDSVYQLTGIYPPDPESLNAGQVDAIANALQQKGEDNIREFAGLMSDQLGSTEPHWWAAFAFEVNAYLQGDDWTQAARILGLGHLNAGEWLIGWRYSHQLAGPLYRPTVAEAGRYSYHFPSPPGEELGVTMPLDTDLPAVKEVIHAPLKGDTSAQACMGRLGRIAQDFIPDHNLQGKQWLAACRRNHAARLNQHYAAQPVENWLKRHGL